MKKGILMLTLIALIGAAPAFAHCGKCGVGEAKGSKSEGEWIDKKVAHMTEALGLSEEQAGEIKALITEKKAKKKAIRDEYKMKLKGILTAEQYEKYEAMKEEKGSGHDHKGSGHKEMDGHKGSSHKGSH